MILRWLFEARRRAITVLVVLALALAATPRNAERWGDTLQVALPLLAWGCEAAQGRAGEYFLRYAVMFFAVHGSKIGLGESPVNLRPDGGGKGMPSAHTSTAVLGASSLAHDCLRGHPVAQAAAVIGAAFTGSSRIEAGKHDIWQVLMGALLGLGCDRAFRRPSPARARIAAGLAALWAAIADPRAAAVRVRAIGWRLARRATQVVLAAPQVARLRVALSRGALLVRATSRRP